MIRKVEASDIDSITQIYNKYIKDSTVTFETVELATDEMAHRVESLSNEFPYLVYESDNEILGYCYAHKWKEREAYKYTLETTVYVKSGCQGRSIGFDLMKELISECNKAGYKNLIACITKDNVGSCKLHE